MVARAFHGCLRDLESKSASRAASRWGAVLGTAAVASVSAGDLADDEEDALRRLLKSGLPAMLEIGSAVKSAEAWEVEAGLVYDDLAWFLYDELWDVSTAARPELSADERGREIDLLLDPLLDPAVRRCAPRDTRGQCLPSGSCRTTGSLVRRASAGRRAGCPGLTLFRGLWLILGVARTVVHALRTVASG